MLQAADDYGWGAAQVTLGSFHLMGTAHMGSSRETAGLRPDRRGMGRAKPVRGRRLGAADRPRREPDDHDRGRRPQDRPRHGGEAVVSDAANDLLGLYWTGSGPVEVHFGREWSLFDLADRCAQAERAGFKGIGLWHADLEHVLETRTLADVKTLLDDHGLEYLELEFIWEWFLAPDDERRRAAEPTKRLLFEAAAALGAHHIKVGNIPGTPCELPRLTEALRRALRRGGRAHGAKMVYEFMPPDVNVHDLDTALAVVEGAAAPNGGLAIDTWHMAKLGIAPADLRADPGAPARLGRALRRAVGEHGRSGRRGDQPPQASGRGRVPDPRLRRRRARPPATTGRGASRCSPRSSATSRSSRSSTGRTRAAAAQL